MYKMVIDNLTENQQVWQSIPQFAQAVTLLNTRYAALKSEAEREEALLIGVKAQRDDEREKTAELALRIAGALMAYGDANNAIELVSRMRISKSQLVSREHNDTLILLDRILLHAEEHATALEDFGIDPAEITECMTRRDALMSSIVAPRKAINKRKGALLNIQQTIKEIDRLLKRQIDKLVLVTKPGNEEFYNSYFNARVILDHGKNSTNRSDSSTSEF